MVKPPLDPALAHVLAQKGEDLIRRLWTLFSEQRWDEAKSLFTGDFVAEWPQTGERFVGPEDFVDMQAAYPGNHTIEVLHLVPSADRVASAVFVHADTGQTAFGTSFFEIRSGKISRLVEFWGEQYAAPEWREKFSE